jgi:hypothetical protein
VTAVSTLYDWISDVCAELGLELGDERAVTDTVLDLTADVAHGVARPAAPVTAYLVGLAAGRTDDPAAATARLSAQLAERARSWGEGATRQ